MTTTALERTVARVTDPSRRPGYTPDHVHAMVVEPGRWRESDPFLMLAEDWFGPGTFGPHPHRGFETVTLVLEGAVAHEDNHGGRGILGPGDAQWMTAGRGVIHGEEPPPGQRAHVLQLWLNLPGALKMTEPRYQDLRAADIPIRREPGAELRVFSGTSGGVRGPALNHVPVTMVDMRVAAGASVAQDLRVGDNGFLYVLEGRGRFGAAQTVAQAGQVVWLGPAGDAASEMVVRADERLRAVLWAGTPIGEAVVAQGPFVMNTAAEIARANADFRAGRF
jgi:quercetin 2,3-dioxygenase